jgi:hypothetical protein
VVPPQALLLLTLLRSIAATAVQMFINGGSLSKALVYLMDRVSNMLLPNWFITDHGRNVP